MVDKRRTAIELYRLNEANPATIEELRFWAIAELRRIEAGFVSADSVIQALASILDGMHITQPENGKDGEKGKDGEPGRGVRATQSLSQPSNSEPGDIWFVTGNDGISIADVRALSPSGQWVSIVGPEGDSGSSDLISDGEVKTDKTWSSRKIESVISAMNLFADPFPKLSHDLDANGKVIDKVQRINITGISATYTEPPPPFLDITSDHTWDYANVTFPAIVEFAGVHTVNQSMNIFGGGLLFYARPEIRFSPGAAFAASVFTLASQGSYIADNGAGNTVTAFGIYDISSQEKLEAQNGSAFQVNAYVHMTSALVVRAGVNVGEHIGQEFLKNSAPSPGTVERKAGYLTEADAAPDHNIHFMAGSTGAVGSRVPAVGDWAFYQGDEYPHFFNGAEVQKTATSNADYTLTLADRVWVCTNGSAARTISLPTAASIPAKYGGLPAGLTYTVKRKGAGAVTVSGNGANIDGAATYDIPAQYDFVKVIWDGLDWSIINR